MENKTIVPTSSPDGCIEIGVSVFDEHIERAMKVGMKVKIDGKWYGWNEKQRKSSD